MKNKEAVGNLGEEEINFLKKVRQTREETRQDANALFTTSHQNRKRDRALLEKLFVQFPGAMVMANSLLKEAGVKEAGKNVRLQMASAASKGNGYAQLRSGARNMGKVVGQSIAANAKPMNGNAQNIGYVQGAIRGQAAGKAAKDAASSMLPKTASWEAYEQCWEEYEKIKIAYNVHAFFEAGGHLDQAQQRYPELQKVARPALRLKKVNSESSTSGSNSVGSTMSGATV